MFLKTVSVLNGLVKKKKMFISYYIVDNNCIILVFNNLHTILSLLT